MTVTTLNKSFSIRPAIPSDASAIILIHRLSVRGAPANYYPADIIEEWSSESPKDDRAMRLAKRIEDGEEHVVVAYDGDGSLVGFGLLKPALSEISAVYVIPDCAGKGVGRAILGELERMARAMELRELRLDASLNAEAFYNSSGFLSEEVSEHVLQSGKRMDCVRMRKAI